MSYSNLTLPIVYADAHWSVRKQAREQYVKMQGGLCHFCDQSLTKPPSSRVTQAVINKSLFPQTMFKYPVHLHHDRKTGLTIGAVHARCNAYLWQYLGE